MVWIKSVGMKISARIRHLEDRLKNSPLGKRLCLDESYTSQIIRLIYKKGLNRIEKRRATKITVKILYFITALSPFMSPYVSFILIAAAYFIYLLGNVGICDEFSDFDVLLVVFSCVIISVASVGRPTIDIALTVLVYGSFITLYFVTVSAVRGERELIIIKLLYSVSGAIIAAIQIVQNVLSFEIRVLGQLYVLCVPMAIELFFEVESKRMKAFLALISFMMLAALTICWSGGTWVWATFILAYFIAIKNWKLLLLGGIGVLFIPVILPGEIINIAEITEEGLLDYFLNPSKGYRISSFRAVGVLLRFYKNYEIAGKWYASLIMFSCLLIVVTLLIREILLNMRKARAGMVCAVMAAVGCGVTGFIYSGIGADLFENYPALLIFWVYTSIYSADAHIKMREEKGKITGSEKVRFCFIDYLPPMLAAAFLLAVI